MGILFLDSSNDWGSSSFIDSVQGQLAASGKQSNPEKLSSLKTISTALKTSDGACMIAVHRVLTDVLRCVSDKSSDVADLAHECVDLTVQNIQRWSMKMFVPVLLQACHGSYKPVSQVKALDSLCVLCKNFPLECNMLAVDMIPIVSPLLNDIKEDVRVSSQNLMTEICNHVHNRDIEPLVPKILSAMKTIGETEECIQSLAATTFVQVVSSAALSLVVPLLVRGFKERKTAVKRQCAVIIENMSKLVFEPKDAIPFLPLLVPPLERAKEEISDPEARDRCAKAFMHLQRIQREASGRAGISYESVTHEASKAFGDSPYIIDLVTSLCELGMTESDWKAALAPFSNGSNVFANLYQEYTRVSHAVFESPVDETHDAEELCNCTFTLAYGSKILLHNTVMKLSRGYRYGLLGGNNSGKTTLMRAISNGQVDGFPPADELKTVFVEADIQGELSALSVLDYVLADHRMQGIDSGEIEAMLTSVGFTERMIRGGVSHLSGGWRMKLALARAMLQKADILLMDDPTSHLDVINVAWVKDYLKSLTEVTSIIVSHHKEILNEVCTDMIQIKDLKLVQERGNLESYMATHPDVKGLFESSSTPMVQFSFPDPGFIEGVKSRGKPLMKMDNCTFTYPGNDVPTLRNITVRASMASRVACLGVNGAGKSTMIKLLTGQLVPQEGDVWKHPNCRVAYVAQHAFAQIEQHLDKTANEYIRWRYQGGEDKESLEKASLILTEDEEEKIKQEVELSITNDEGTVIKVKRRISGLTGARRTVRKENEYEIRFDGMSHDSNIWYPGEKLAKLGWEKHLKALDDKIALRSGQYVRPLTKENVESHLEDLGVDREFGTHNRMKALSDGQKVKVVFAAALWNQPHILILDEPTNFMDRDALAALSQAIETFGGGVVIISHNSEFVSNLCKETWVLEGGCLDCHGDAEWMENVMNEKTEFKQQEEITDALGNVSKVKKPKKKLSRKELKAKMKIRKAKLERGEELSSDEEWIE